MFDMVGSFRWPLVFEYFSSCTSKLKFLAVLASNLYTHSGKDYLSNELLEWLALGTGVFGKFFYSASWSATVQL